MIPAGFDYVAPDSLDEALEALAADPDAKALAGGHSLIPMMRLRFAQPSTLVDLRRIPGLKGIEPANGRVRVGAMTTHHQVDAAGLGLASAAAHTIADQQVRNRGTIGGSLAHGDRASDLPAVLLALEGAVTAMKTGGGSREIPAADLFKGYMTTALEPGELLTEVHLPVMEGYGYGYEKFARRKEDWAMVAVSALVQVQDGTVADVRVGLTHMAAVPLRATAVEDALRGQPANAESIARAAEQAAEGTNPPTDLNATADYKRHLARVLTRRALMSAIG
ncbi:MAG: aerobic carbon-monoxide dehydrogenase medium subunit [Thermoleophilaceae bacterium]|nr:aerobic carbon-monoxide dehydrogenase medium subunit [Thermoleophilaceae bacterium]